MKQRRRGRRIVGDPDHNAVWAVPKGFTRASRRGAGIRQPVWAEAMRQFHAVNQVLPRAVRRIMRDPLKAERRFHRYLPRVQRALARKGLTV